MTQAVTDIRMPGVYFLPPPRSGQGGLPPLDVAGFVGFAQRGPLDTPVRIEDFQSYTDIFGGDLALAREAGGRTVWANLPQAVSSFFSNGGRRCYVVRVAGKNSTAAQLQLPGVIALARSGPDWQVWPATLEASSAGRWSDQLQIGSRLSTEAQRVRDDIDVPDVVAADGDNGPITLVHWIVQETGDSVQTGDVLRLTYADGSVWLTRVESADSDPVAATQVTLALSAGRLVFAAPSAQLPLAVLTEVVAITSGPAMSRTGWFQQGPSGFTLQISPAQAAGISGGILLQITLGGRAYLLRVAGSQFVKPDPISGLIPGPSGEVVQINTSEMIPLVPATVPTDFPVRIEMLRLDLLLTYAPSPARLVEDMGFNAGHLAFFGITAAQGSSKTPPPVGQAGPGANAGLADTSDDVEESDGQDVHSAGNDPVRDPAAVAQLSALVAPILPADIRDFSLSDVTFFPLGMDDVFTPIHFNGPDPDDSGDDDLATFDPTLFYDAELVEAASTAATLLTTAFNFKFVRQPAVALHGLHSLLFEDEVALVALPDATQRPWQRDIVPAPPPIVLPPVPPSPEWLQFGDCDYAPPVVVPPTVAPAAPPSPTLPLSDAPNLYKVDSLLTTHQIMLTFCQARADVLGIFALPSHFRTAQCIDWQTQFRGRYSLPPRTTQSDNLRDMANLSYATVFHPWFQMADANEPDGLKVTPPEGAACGLIAGRERARGVWVAAGNLPVADVLGLSPVLPLADMPDLFDRRFNLFGEQAGVFKILSGHTLGDGQELLQISVRRLMILLRKIAQQRGLDFVFQNNDRLLAESVRAGLLSMLKGMFDRGAFAGATPQESYRVITGDDVNPRQSVEAGKFVAVIQVAPSQPLEFITVVLIRQADGSLQVKGG